MVRMQHCTQLWPCFWTVGEAVSPCIRLLCLAKLVHGMQIANMLVAAKTDDVCILDVSNRCSFTEHMVLATARSHRHIQAAASAVAYQVSPHRHSSAMHILCSMMVCVCMMGQAWQLYLASGWRHQ